MEDDKIWVSCTDSKDKKWYDWLIWRFFKIFW